METQNETVAEELTANPIATAIAACVITDAMKADAKAKYGDKVKLRGIPLDENETRFLDVLVIPPSRKVVGEFEKWADRDPNKAKEIVVKACLLTWKDQVMADDDIFNCCFSAISDLISIRKAVVKKF